MGIEPAVLEFLDAWRDSVLFCRDRHGRPIGYPMRTLAYTETSLTFTTYAKSAKVANLLADPRVSILVVDEGADPLHWVSIAGVARVVVPDEATIQRVFGGRSVSDADRSLEARVPEGISELVRERHRDGKRVLLDVGEISVRAVHLERGGSR